MSMPPHRLLLAAACLVAAASVALVAIIDHRHTNRRLDQAWVSAWYCRHRGTSCDEGKPETVHGAWETREYLYKGTEAILAGLFVATLVPWRRLSRGPRWVRQS